MIQVKVVSVEGKLVTDSREVADFFVGKKRLILGWIIRKWLYVKHHNYATPKSRYSGQTGDGMTKDQIISLMQRALSLKDFEWATRLQTEYDSILEKERSNGDSGASDGDSGKQVDCPQS